MLEQLKEYIHSTYSVSDIHIQHFHEEEIHLPTGRKFSRNPDKLSKWVPPLDLVSKVTDYDELKEARRNANVASWLALVAIVISLITLNLTREQVNISKIQDLISRKIIQTTDKINLATLIKLKKINKKYKKLKLLGMGDLKDKFEIETNFISKSAKEKVTKLGGKVTIIK